MAQKLKINNNIVKSFKINGTQVTSLKINGSIVFSVPVTFVIQLVNLKIEKKDSFDSCGTTFYSYQFSYPAFFIKSSSSFFTVSKVVLNGYVDIEDNSGYRIFNCNSQTQTITGNTGSSSPLAGDKITVDSIYDTGFYAYIVPSIKATIYFSDGRSTTINITNRFKTFVTYGDNPITLYTGTYD